MTATVDTVHSESHDWVINGERWFLIYIWIRYALGIKRSQEECKRMEGTLSKELNYHGANLWSAFDWGLFRLCRVPLLRHPWHSGDCPACSGLWLCTGGWAKKSPSSETCRNSSTGDSNPYIPQTTWRNTAFRESFSYHIFDNTFRNPKVLWSHDICHYQKLCAFILKHQVAIFSP